MKDSYAILGAIAVIIGMLAFSYHVSSDKYACQKQVKAVLKDPDSIKVLDWNDKTRTITYSATNTYGGRVKDSHTCYSSSN